MAPAKKYRVRMRLKVKRRFLRNSGLFFALLSAALLLGYSGFRGYKALSAASPGRIFAFTLRSYSAVCPSEEISAEVGRRLSGRKGGAFSGADAAALAAELRAAYPALGAVSVKRSLFGGRVTVKAESEAAVARVRLNGSGPVYLSGGGRILAGHYGPEPEELFETELRAAPGENLAALAAFLRELRAAAPGFSSKPSKLECPPPDGPERMRARSGAGAACRLTLENGTAVLWGDFDATAAKVSRLNAVLADAPSRLAGPLKVDLRYFRDGKVFVSKSSDI